MLVGQSSSKTNLVQVPNIDKVILFHVPFHLGEIILWVLGEDAIWKYSHLAERERERENMNQWGPSHSDDVTRNWRGEQSYLRMMRIIRVHSLILQEPMDYPWVFDNLIEEVPRKGRQQ